ncbi:hypothetical protein BGM19_38640 [Streptomyces agglomeratus]|uniref:Intersectin-EH binding protein Ibp1 n=1 Tax=Streptomyces agglomeratus TaxID=285458 RepID=A0A1E5NYP1_9ACTN|nr:hypothetical protein [Streptomyces agglomeratus]OEJ21408.1 hypothetical protein AS594_38200 [Streptomyces agglomeratus]OEJ36409.1 hypothetical protein BGK72_37420 [Streptomyces agglomeratus]OEJ56570.1 hypothetical protein BGM19_38640 [Streptomyces agglomeratus]
MFTRKKIAVVSVLAGGLAMACTSVTAAYAGQGVQTCTRDVMGNLTCHTTQHIKGQLPEGGVMPHRETCTPVKPLIVPSAMGGGTMRLGPEVTCSPTTSGVPGVADGDQQPFGLL